MIWRESKRMITLSTNSWRILEKQIGAPTKKNDYLTNKKLKEFWKQLTGPKKKIGYLTNKGHIQDQDKVVAAPKAG